MILTKGKIRVLGRARTYKFAMSAVPLIATEEQISIRVGEVPVAAIGSTLADRPFGTRRSPAPRGCTTL